MKTQLEVTSQTNHWESRPLGEVFEVVGGGTPSKKVAAYYGGSIPWATIRDMHSDELSSTEHTITPIGLKNSSAKLIPAGEVLMASRVGLGKACILQQATAINQDIRALIPINSERIERRFCLYWLQSIADQIRAAGSGATVQGIKLPFIKSLLFPSTPLDEQERIVAVLDQAFAALDRARAHVEANLADADELLEGSKNNVIGRSHLGAHLVSLDEVASINSTLVDPRQPEFIEMPHIGAGNMVSGTDSLVDVMTAKQEGLKSGKYLFDDTMVLYSKIRPYLRKVARPDFSGVCSADVYPLSPSPKLDRNFLFHILHTKDFTEYAISGSARAGMPKVNREHLFKYEFWLPPLVGQIEAANKIDLVMEATDRLKAALRLKLKQIVDLRQSLLQKAFAGDLV